MLGVSKYEQSYVNEARAKLKSQVAAYNKLIATCSDQGAIAKFEPVFFNNLALTMDMYFTHRLRKVEGKDGNALNEMRNLSASLMENGGKFSEEKTFKLDPEKSVLGYEVGDMIELTAGDFAKLSKAFFAEIESKFV